MQEMESKGAPSAKGAITPNRVLVALLAFSAILGVFLSYRTVRGIPEPESVRMVSAVLLSLLTFAWFWIDSEFRAYKRSPFLSVSIVALGVLAIPYYLLRSRPKGQRLKALGKWLGFVLLMMLAFVMGNLPIALLAA